jgi:hypothetical protein
MVRVSAGADTDTLQQVLQAADDMLTAESELARGQSHTRIAFHHGSDPDRRHCEDWSSYKLMRRKSYSMWKFAMDAGFHGIRMR